MKLIEYDGDLLPVLVDTEPQTTTHMRLVGGRHSRTDEEYKEDVKMYKSREDVVGRNVDIWA